MQYVGIAALAGRSAGYVLPHLDAEIGATMRLRVAVHRSVEEPAGVRLLLADDEARRFKQRDSDARATIVRIVEDADLPWAGFLRLAAQARREAVQREDEGLVRLADQFFACIGTRLKE